MDFNESPEVEGQGLSAEEIIEEVSNEHEESNEVAGNDRESSERSLGPEPDS